MSDTVSQIKERLSIVDVVTPYVKLTKAGRSYRGLSPFNKEKTPSFFVSPDRGFYHCFSSGKGGDMFTFIQEMEGVDFKGALKILAEKAGVEITPERPGARDEREKIFGALERASVFFAENLSQRADALEYLKGRGLSVQSIRAWNIGYALDDWRSLADALVKEGFTQEDLLRAGLVKQPEQEEGSAGAPKRPYDRFRGRIMFPIRDTSGRVIAFSGRTFGSKDQNAAKYLNSPETAVFDKSRALFGFDRAKDSIRKVNFSILVEGQLDLLLSHQSGFTNAVATSGTALTAEHLMLVKRMSNNVVIGYDGDGAGVAAALRASSLALVSSMNVKVALLPEGKDPADLIKENHELWRTVIREAQHPVEFLVTRLRHIHTDARSFNLAVAREVLPVLARVQSKIDQEHFIKIVAEALGTPESAVREELLKVPADDATVPDVLSGIARDISPRKDAILERLAAAAAFFKNDEARVADIWHRLNTLITPEGCAILKELPAARISELLFEFERLEAPRSPEAEIEELFSALKPLVARDAYERTMRALKDAEAAGDTAREKELLGQLNELRRDLES